MSFALRELWDEERRHGFLRLAGTRARATVPVRDALIARIIDGLPLPSAVTALGVRSAAGGQLIVDVTVRVFGFAKRVRVPLRIAPSVPLERPRTLRLAFIERSLLSSAMGLAGSFFGKLPEGIAVDDAGVHIDLDRAAARAGLAALWQHVRELSFSTDDGVVWLSAAIEIEPVQAPPAGDEVHDGAGKHAGGVRRSADLAALAPLLEGFRLDYDVRAEESLVNEAVAALTRAMPPGGLPAGANTAPTGWRERLAAQAPPALRFETGAVRVRGTVSL